MHIQPVGSGAAAVKYLGTYVARTAINDARIVAITQDSVIFHWKDRSDGGRTKLKTLPGIELVRLYLPHVLPLGLRSLRYYGFCHPAAKAARLRVQLHSGKTVDFGPSDVLPDPDPASSPPPCPKCGQATQWVFSLRPCHQTRGPPAPAALTLSTSTTA